MTASRLANLIFFLWIILITVPRPGNGIRPPSYISPWHFMNTSLNSTLTVQWDHGLEETPVYADVQVRSNNTGFIYPGITSGFIENDEIRGGVIFWYNSTHVELRGPRPGYTGGRHYIIFTGELSYNTDNAENLTSGDVRVRLWRDSDFPPPTYTVPQFYVTSMDNHEKSHPLGVVPAFTVVQLELIATVPTGRVSQAQGSYSFTSFSHDGGGTAFGVNSSFVRLLTYNNVFSYCHGWGAVWSSSGCEYSSARVTIRMWACLESELIFNTSVPHSIQNDNDSHDMSISTTFSHDEDLIVVRAESTTGSLPGYYFDGIGAAMLDSSPASTSYKLGGLVYSTSNVTQTLRMWHPLFYSSTDYERCIARMRGHCITGANVHVAIYKGDSYTPVLTNAHVVERQACYYEYACDYPYTHTAGDLSSWYADGVWNGTKPTCVSVNCETVEGGTNAILRLHDNLKVNITYTCVTGHVLVSGNLSRLCVETSPNIFEWTGTAPNCQPANANATVPNTTICHNVGESTPEIIQEAIEMAEKISKNLTVKVKSTGAFKRTLICAQDSRETAAYVGVVGYVVFAIVFGFIAIVDGLNVLKCCESKINKKQ